MIIALCVCVIISSFDIFHCKFDGAIWISEILKFVIVVTDPNKDRPSALSILPNWDRRTAAYVYGTNVGLIYRLQCVHKT